MTMLHCPGVTTYDSPCDTVRSLCGKDATYQIEGSVYCYIHANQVMSDAEKKRHPDLAHCANPECLDPWYIPSRKPRKDQLNFCRTCGKSAMADRLRKRRQRAKAEREWKTNSKHLPPLNVKIKEFLEKRI